MLILSSPPFCPQRGCLLMRIQDGGTKQHFVLVQTPTWPRKGKNVAGRWMNSKRHSRALQAAAIGLSPAMQLGSPWRAQTTYSQRTEKQRNRIYNPDLTSYSLLQPSHAVLGPESVPGIIGVQNILSVWETQSG